MRDYAVVGAGAIGGSLAAHLATQGCDVTLIDTDSEHVAAIRASGITFLSEESTLTTGPLDATSPKECADRFRCVLLAMKAHQLESALPWLESHLSADGFVVVCQNGLGYLPVATRFGTARVIPALINFAADRVGPGTISVGGPGELVFGAIDGAQSQWIGRLLRDFKSFGHVRATTNITGLLWSKRILAALLTATALVDGNIVELVSRHRRAMIALASETAMLARAQGVRLEKFDGIDWARLREDPKGTLERVVAYLQSVPNKKRSGVFRDIQAGRVPTEASRDLSQLLETAQVAGVEVPRLIALRKTISDLEEGQETFSRTHLDRLDESIR